MLLSWLKHFHTLRLQSRGRRKYLPLGIASRIPAALAGRIEPLEDRTLLSTLPRVSVVASPSSVGEDGTTNATFRFTRTAPVTDALVVNFTVDGDATFGEDYTTSEAGLFAANLVVFEAGQSSATITMDPKGDQLLEPNESVIVTLAEGTGYTLGTSRSAKATIANDDSAISVAVSATGDPFGVAVAEDGKANLIYTFTRTGALGALTVDFSVSTDAIVNSDFTQSGANKFKGYFSTLSFAAGQAKKTITLDPIADSITEVPEFVTLTLRQSKGYTVGESASATGFILDTVPRVTLAVTSASQMENRSGNAIFTFQRTGSLDSALTVTFLVSGTASFVDEDYSVRGAESFSESDGSVIFAPGQSTARVFVDPTDDKKAEQTETVLLKLDTGSDYTVGTLTDVKATIADDDTEIGISVSPATVTEDGSTNLVYTFTRTGLKTSALTVTFDVGMDSAATLGTDFTQSGAATFTKLTGTVAFLAGQTTKKITVDPIADSLVESNEFVTLILRESPVYSLDEDATFAVGVITNDDPRVLIAAQALSIAEDGDTTNFQFIRTGSTSSELTVNFIVTGTATFDEDYVASGAEFVVNTFGVRYGTVMFPIGSATTTVAIFALDDSDGEEDETVVFTVTEGVDYLVGAPTAATVSIISDDLMDAMP